MKKLILFCLTLISLNAVSQKKSTPEAPITKDIVGTWTDKYKVRYFNLGTTSTYTRRFSYTVCITQKGENQYTGIAITKELTSPPWVLIPPTYVLQTSFTLTKNGSEISTQETGRINSAVYESWPLKSFKLRLNENEMTMKGKSTTPSYYTDLELTKISNEVDPEYQHKAEELLAPKVEIDNVRFTSIDNKDFLGYMGSGTISFEIINRGKMPTEPLSLSFSMFSGETIKIIDVKGPPENQVLNGGQTFYCSYSIKAIDRINGNKVDLGVAVTTKNQKKQLCYKEFPIPVMQD